MSAASCTESWAYDLLVAARRRVGEICDELAVLCVEAGGLAAEAQWQSRAADGFRGDADAIAADLGTLLAGVGLLHDDLLLTRPQPSLWQCR